jgi:iron complex outermembrane recepter protein
MIRFQGARLARIARGMAWAMMAALVTTGPAAYAQDTTAVSTGSAESSADLMAQTHRFDIPAGSLDAALTAFSEQTGIQLVYEPAGAQGQTVQAIVGTLTATSALQLLIDDAGLTWVSVNDTTIALRRADGASANPTAGGEGIDLARRGGIEEIIVTGQKREERIQDVPIAISAFSADDLSAQKLEGGFDLLKAIPNVSFSKTNFTGYNFQIRGIGTQAISATTDPAVAVSFNSTTLIANRLFEQEYLDVQRVEVLRGPQGTLYGRNATGGVINVIPETPKIGSVESSIKYETGNYNASRFTAMINRPLGENVAIRGAFASTKRDGFTTNEFDGSSIDGRDLSTGRVTLGWEPINRLRVDLMWEHFEENDDRLRSAKNLCHRDNGADRIGDLDVGPLAQAQTIRRTVEQGCLPGSLYSSNAYGTPNGDALPVVTAGRINNDILFQAPAGGYTTLRINLAGSPTLLTNADVYANTTQSRNLRSVYSPIKPQYKASADLYDLTLRYEWTEALAVTSRTVYNEDTLFSTQDFTRFEASPGLFSEIGLNVPNIAPEYENFTPGGVFCDPQLGCSDSFLAQDISQSESTQLNQQFELASSFGGAFDFSLGVNYTQFKTKADYFVFANVFTALAMSPPFNGHFHPCTTTGVGCVSIQQENLNETAANPYGHNFFLSRNPYELNSAGVFGEAYWQATDTVKLTAGLRMTWDRKVFTPVPSQTLLADYREASVAGAPSVSDPSAGPDGCLNLGLLCGVLGNAPGGRGYPTNPDIVQVWREPTGRIVLDWTPDLPFTDQTLVYASYSRGYKGGGANPPSIAPPAGNFIKAAQGAVAPPTFLAEYVNAYEIGTKNTVLGGSVVLNASAFLYDYENYQVSKIVDRSAANENFDATIAGIEIEAMFAPTLEWNVNAVVGYLYTRIADGEQSIDLMDRTQGGGQFHVTSVQNPNYDPTAPQLAVSEFVAGLTTVDAGGNSQPIPSGQRFLAFDDWVVVKPNAAQSSNCVAPADLLAEKLRNPVFNTPINALQNVNSFCAGGSLLGTANVVAPPLGYAASKDAPNGGAGFFDDIGGNELPNSPRVTVSLGTQYTLHLPMAWDLTGRVDWYWQGSSYARVYNTEYDRLKAWSNTNFSVWAEKADWGLKVEAYVKNAFDESPITGSFLNSDDSGLTTNVFTLDPRLVGVSISKNF